MYFHVYGIMLTKDALLLIRMSNLKVAAAGFFAGYQSSQAKYLMSHISKYNVPSVSINSMLPFLYIIFCEYEVSNIIKYV